MKITRENFLKKGSSFIFTLTLVMSLVVVSSLGSQAANSQSNDACTKLSIPNISANFERAGNEAAKAIDSSLSSKWAYDGEGAYIQADLGSSAVLCSIDIAWFRGDTRSYNFVVSVSDDGQTFRDIVSGKSTGTTVMQERYNIPDTSARYLRVTVNGNSLNNLAAISDMTINGRVVEECSIPQISGVAAIGNDGNVPQNTLDSNLNTRWSNLGFPSWIQYDLGESQPICNVDIAWWRGNFRVNTFTISVSNDGTNFTPIFSGQSSGQTIGLERYDISDTFGRYMRITVIGNNENSWSSISEVRINGGAETPPPPPQEICGNGIDDDGDGLVDEGCPPGDGDGQTDPFGIKKIYPTKAGGEEWFMDMTDGQDPRSNPPSLRKNSDGSFKVTSSQVRYGTFTSSGYDDDKIETLDHSRIAQKGYMQSPNDRRDVELTGYV